MNTWGLLLLSDSIRVLLRLIDLAWSASHNEGEGSEERVQLRKKEMRVVDLQLSQTHAEQTHEHISSFTHNSTQAEE